MSGIYIHIPFCKQKCTYCDFYTIVAPSLIDKTVDAIVSEIAVRKDYLSDKHIQTIYFGGGTPSLLNINHFNKIFSALHDVYYIDQQAEITMEANPDDLDEHFLSSIRTLPFNRLSIGIQSFNDAELKFINRRHTGQQAIEAVKNAQKAGFNNISIDLIYGLPEQSAEIWEQNIEQALQLNVQHISAYGLTFEEGTVLWRQLKKGMVLEAPDEKMNRMYETLRTKIEKAGFEAYEISNFSLPGRRSQHNSAYWKMIPYIGIGPSAHSYNGENRQWNISSVKEYGRKLENAEPFWETEQLSVNDNFNDYIMVALRTAEGCDMDFMRTKFGNEYADAFLSQTQKYIISNHISFDGQFISLTITGIEISNFIISDLMKV